MRRRSCPVEFEDRDESLGTVVWLGLLGPMLDALRDGTVLLADELDSSLHPRLVEEVVRLFQDPVSNPRNAQLIANAFDTALLGDSVSPRVLGRDQVWLADKSPDGATVLRSLADYAPRKEEDLAGRYLRGRYGGVPLIDHHEFADIVEPRRDPTRGQAPHSNRGRYAGAPQRVGVHRRAKDREAVSGRPGRH